MRRGDFAHSARSARSGQESERSSQPVIRPAARLVYYTMAGTLAVLVLAAVFGVWRLSSGPVSLGFLTPYIEDALNAADSPYRIEFDDTILAWAGWDRTLDIRILGVRAIREEGGIVASVPEIAFGISAPALLRGVIAPASLDIIEPVLQVRRNEDGGIELGLGESELAADGAGDAWLADLLASPDPDRPMTYLRRVSIVGADITVDDRRLRFAWRAPRATVSMQREGAGLAAAADFILQVGDQEAKMKAAARYSGDGDIVDAWLVFTGLRPEWFAEQDSTLAMLGLARMPLSGRLDAKLGFDGIAREIAFDVSAGAGTLMLGDWLEEDLDIQEARVRGLVVPGDERLRLDEGFIDLGVTRIDLEGVIEGFNVTPRIDVRVTTTAMPADDLRRYWPVSLASNTRKWIIDNITDGTLLSAEAKFDITPEQMASGSLPAEAIQTRLDLQGFTIDYFHPLPRLVDAGGIVTITATTLDIATSGGHYKGLRARPGRVLIEDIAGWPLATIDVVVDGPVGDAMDIIAHPRLGFSERLVVDRDLISGTAETRLRIVVPTSRADERPLVVSATSILRGVGHPGIVRGYDLTQGEFLLELDNDGVLVLGSGALNGVPVDVVWREYFGAEGGLQRSYEINASLDDAQRAMLGMPFAEEVSGNAELAIEIGVTTGSVQLWRASLDLADAEVAIPALLWKKPAGTPLAVDFEARIEPGAPIVVAPINAASEDFRFVGRAELDADGATFRRLDIDALVFGKTDLHGTVHPLGEGGFDVAISGRQLDLRPYLRETAGADDPRQPPLDLTASVGRMLLLGRRRLENVEARLSMRDGAWRALALDGVFRSGKPLSARIEPTERRRVVKVDTDDAGALLKGFGVYDNITGGSLWFRARLDRTGAKKKASGEVRIKDFTIIKAPTFAEILSLASFTGIIDLLAGDGLPFDKLRASFIRFGDTLQIKDMKANNSALGVTLEGTADLGADTIDVSGSLIPAYFWNRLPEFIPFFGDLLVGGEGGGVFGIRYHVFGPRSDPDVSVNPLSVLAPGILGEIFTPRLDDESWKELEQEEGSSKSSR